MKIEWLISGSAPEWIEQNYENGGYVYDTYARKVLRESHDVTVTYICRGRANSKARRLLQLSRYSLKMRSLSLQGEIVFRGLYSTVFAPFDKVRKHVVILHHIDTSGFDNRTFYDYFTKRFFKKVQLADVVVVVSEYWKNILTKLGCPKVVVIHNSFDLTQFEFDKQELTDFCRKLGIPNDKPIIYLGNARPEKGYLESYEALKNIDAIFLTTGKKNTNLPILHTYLSYRDYLRLLRISSLVITMSKFNEGWCRTAHEAMLCGTPVIGSGRGGMRELLQKGGQIICRDFSKLGPLVADLLNDKIRLAYMAVKGKEYASQFTIDHFRENWLDLISSFCG